jgi:hypothetical protein
MASTMGEHHRWTIRVVPQAKDEDWRAIVEVWPPELSTRTHAGVVVPFSASAEDESAIVALGMAAAERYIDQASR